jgi:hypothetical protein
MVGVVSFVRDVPLSSTTALTEGVGGGDFTFNMTAGDDEGGNTGYARVGNSFAVPPIGSIDAEPISGEVLDACVENDSTFAIAFVGDIASTLAGLTVWVDGVEYPPDSDWAFSGVTLYVVTSSPPVFLDTVSYFIEIK